MRRIYTNPTASSKSRQWASLAVDGGRLRRAAMVAEENGHGQTTSAARRSKKGSHPQWSIVQCCGASYF